MKIKTIACVAVALMLATVFTISAFAEPNQDQLKDGTGDNCINDCDRDKLLDGTCGNYINDCDGDKARDRRCEKSSNNCNGDQQHDRDRLSQDI